MAFASIAGNPPARHAAFEPGARHRKETVTYTTVCVSAQLYGGWPMILSGLKTWLETGQQLTTPGSLMYQQR
jgi:hypothetical protein